MPDDAPGGTRTQAGTAPPLTVSRAALLDDGSDRAFRQMVHDMLTVASRMAEMRDRLGAAMGVFLEIESLGLPAGTVVNLVFAVSLNDTVRLHRRKAVVAHISSEGAGLMMQGRSRYSRPSSACPSRSIESRSRARWDSTS